jgi:uncharacterized membrane protein YhaH (DUF805 family)
MRGRMNRATYWSILGGMVVFVIAVAAFGVRPPRIAEGLLIFLCVPRLHDLGRSGWWVLIPLGVEVAALLAVFSAFSADDAPLIFGGIFLVIAVVVVVLGLIPGQQHANRFGEPPKSIFPFRERRKVEETGEIFK